ncbi:MAG: hypothetical protein KKB59_18205 [Spirochaetes bacterium]|nr:hypothetical protein [Spirochaetota bacterium]
MEKDASKIISKVATKEAEFKARFERMDNDFDIWDEVTSLNDKAIDKTTKRHASDIEIISNDLRLHADGVQSIISASEMQVRVFMAEAEGEDKSDDIGKLERLFRFAQEEADKRLIKLLLPPMRETIIWCSAIRGWTAARILVEKGEKGSVIFNLMPLDPRWLTYEVGADGLLWTAYKTFRSRDSINSEYNEGVGDTPWWKSLGKNESDLEVIDYWAYEGKGEMANAVVCDNQWLKEPETYDMRSMPIIIIPVATRPSITTISNSKERAVAGYGDSIFAPIRVINGLRNRYASMVATHADKLARQPLINYKDGQGRELNFQTNVPGSVIELEMGHNKLEPSPMKEISPTTIGMLDWLTNQVESALLPRVDIGRPPPSGTLYSLVQETGNRVLNPQLQNIETFYAEMFRLIEEQLIDGGIRVNVKQENERKYFETKVTPVDLKKPHIIEVTFTARTPYEQLETAQIADMLQRAGIPQRWIWEHIYKFSDPKLMEDLAVMEIYEHSPQGMQKRIVEVLMDKGYVFEAKKLIAQMDTMEAQEQGVIPSEEEGPPAPQVE